MKRVLVTGGSGFIGSHLCARLVAEGAYVIALDNFYTGRRENVRRLLEERPDRFELVRGDVCQPLKFEDVEEIYALACPASPVHYQRHPVQTIRTSVLGTLNALELAREVDARLLLTSTSEVYGDPQVHPQVETYWGNVNPIGPRANYDEGKRCAESLCVSYAAQYGVEVRIARIFNTYGPRMCVDDGRVVSNFIVQALRGEPITIYGDGSQTRSFQYVDDLIGGLTRLMKVDDQYKSNSNAGDMHNYPVNLGNPTEFTIRELAEKVVSRLGGRIEYRPLPKDDPTRRKPDISRAKALLNWEPKVGLDDGLAKTIEYFSSIPDIRKTA